MKFRAFIGIDVSKSTIDIYLRNAGRHAVFVNDLKGFEAMSNGLWTFWDRYVLKK